MKLFNFVYLVIVTLKNILQTEKNYDTVQVYEFEHGLKKRIFGNFSGTSLPQKITSTSSNLFVRFQSDAGHSYSSTYYSYYAFELIFMTNKKNS